MSVSAFNLIESVPDHRFFQLCDGKGNITNVPMILDDDYSIKASSKFGQLWEASPNNLMNLLANSANIPSGQFALQGAQIWQSSEPLSFDISVNIYADTDSYNDVICSVKNLMCTCLPTMTSQSSKGLAGATEQLVQNTLGVKLQTLIPPGPNIQAIVKTMSANTKRGYQIQSATRGGAKGLYYAKIGTFRLYNALVLDVNPTFSKEVSFSNAKQNYYPISASVQLTLSSFEIATTDMITGLFA